MAPSRSSPYRQIPLKNNNTTNTTSASKLKQHESRMRGGVAAANRYQQYHQQKPQHQRPAGGYGGNKYLTHKNSTDSLFDETADGSPQNYQVVIQS